jgi:uncharacterized membrane protein
MKRDGGDGRSRPPVLPPATPVPPEVVVEDERTGGKRVSMVSASLHMGPLPPADVLEKYDRIVPGSAERIIGWVETESQHRRAREIEAQAQYGSFMATQLSQAKLGLILGFILALAAMGAAVVALVTGHETAAAVIGGLDIVGLASIFVYGSRQQQRESEQNLDITRSSGGGE